MKLSLVVDMEGCPNRCKHCWLGHMKNKRMEAGADEFIVNYFKPYFEEIVYYSWLREPDYNTDYKKRWEKDNSISINNKPVRHELASFYNIVRDPEYVKFLKAVGPETVQLTFFGLEKMTDKYVGRKGAFRELIKATEILIENDISVRWQAFINKENKEEVVKLLALIRDMNLKQRVTNFQFFCHHGSCEGENAKLYHLRLDKEEIPKELIPYILDHDNEYEEREIYRLLENDDSFMEITITDEIVIYVANTFDIYFNYTNMTPPWKIGNIKTEAPEGIVAKIKSQDVKAINIARSISIGDLVKTYGDHNSKKAFFIDDYKMYLLNKHLNKIG